MSSYYEKIHATGEVKCIDEEIPFEIPQGWEWCRLNDLALYRKGPFGSSLTKSMFVAKSNQSVKVYEQKNAIQKDFRLGDYYISKEKFEAMQSFIVKPNDIIVSCAGTIGETYLLPLDAPVGIINQALMRVTLFDLSIAEYWQMYFAYMLLNEAQMKGAGSAIKNIPPFEYLKAVLVPVPPLSEQNRLVERYNLLLSLIAKYESEADKLNCLNLNIYDKLKKTVLQEAIQGKLVPQIAEEGTAQELLDQIKTEKQKLVKEGKLKKSALNDSVIFRGDDNKYYEQIGKKCLDITEQIPFEIPSNWEWCRVRNVSNSYIGLTYKPTDIDEKGTIVLRSCNIRNGKLALDDIVRVSSSISEKLLIEENDIIICARNGSKRLVGKSALIRNLSEPMTFGAFMAICKTPIYEYMFAYLQSDLFFGQLRDVSNTTTINQLTQNKFNDFLIPIPPIREQERIAFKISQLFQKLR
ncbi:MULTISPECIES: restriction endonuclease subunit S [Bacteroidaceae]|uniref:restriction endonuclease subunit S n=1 Tax=Bacteroidaceae TaxID=815 RepID=UPI001C2C484E|nr:MULTISPECIES: restriction endonuclease subunit S [Bacteroidaceae]MBU9913979.1 restriction endonuclease subunit S [Phocaeicola vulgatus]MBV4373589.1 restriction endonuclease subunit S [Bacteroides thetaiotaomicron]MCB6278507.1 restriction endonuclease subunit S [Phocaeicola vulgatus]MCB7238530.1 restriction endonuclease subunit S [Bacteroides thetaiotaomicron]MCB7442987.1 restriction endonuclease subunit S [Bacteroides thetaiotaomicron]